MLGNSNIESRGRARLTAASRPARPRLGLCLGVLLAAGPWEIPAPALEKGGNDAPVDPALVTPAQSPNTNLPPLTEIIQVRELSPAEAARGYPVRISGVVTFTDNSSYLHFVQDQSSGIYLDIGTVTNDLTLNLQQQIAVVGFSGPGDYAPIIHAQQVRVIGPGAYPDAKAAS